MIVAQKGSREHYLAPRALHKQDMLAGLVTDWYTKEIPWNAESRLPRSLPQAWRRVLGSALAARSAEIPDNLIHSFPWRSLLWKCQVRASHKCQDRYKGYLHTDTAFARAAALMNLPEHDVFFGFSYSSLEVMHEEKHKGILCILDQIDPAAYEFRLVAEEIRQHPELGPKLEFPTAYYARNRREWEIADVIVVNSEWTRDGIVAEGANPAKIEILPLAFEPKSRTTSQHGNSRRTKLPTRRDRAAHRPPSEALRVLWLGQVNARKGIHCLLEAARSLKTERVEFDVVGPIEISQAAINLAPPNLRFRGPVSRDCVEKWYRRSDVFALPTLSDGFAMTQLEALAHGLPVITTPNCARVVVDGRTGFVTPAHDSEALAQAVMQFVRKPSLAGEMLPHCYEAAQAHSIDAYGERLAEIINRRMRMPNTPCDNKVATSCNTQPRKPTL